MTREVFTVDQLRIVYVSCHAHTQPLMTQQQQTTTMPRTRTLRRKTLTCFTKRESMTAAAATATQRLHAAANGTRRQQSACRWSRMWWRHFSSTPSRRYTARVVQEVDEVWAAVRAVTLMSQIRMLVSASARARAGWTTSPNKELRWEYCERSFAAPRPCCRVRRGPQVIIITDIVGVVGIVVVCRPRGVCGYLILQVGVCNDAQDSVCRATRRRRSAGR